MLRTHECNAVRAAGGATSEVVVLAGDAKVLCAGCMSDDYFLRIRALGLSQQLLVYAFDAASYEYVQGAIVGAQVMRWEPERGRQGQRSEHRWVMSMQKALIVARVLECGVNALMSDLDVMLLANPFRHMPPRHIPYDVAVMTDGMQEHIAAGWPHRSRDADQIAFRDPIVERGQHYGNMAELHNFTFGLRAQRYTFDVWENSRTLFNSGFFYAVASPHTEQAFRSWHAHVTSSEAVWDQAAFNEMFNPMGSQWGFALRAYILNPHIAATSMFYDVRSKSRAAFRPMAVHANYVLPCLKGHYLRVVCELEQSSGRPQPPASLSAAPSSSSTQADWSWEGHDAPPPSNDPVGDCPAPQLPRATYAELVQANAAHIAKWGWKLTEPARCEKFCEQTPHGKRVHLCPCRSCEFIEAKHFIPMGAHCQTARFPTEVLIPEIKDYHGPAYDQLCNSVPANRTVATNSAAAAADAKSAISPLAGPNHWTDDTLTRTDLDRHSSLSFQDIAHVTYTHTSYDDVWPLLWPQLRRFTYLPDVSFVLCINRRDARVPGWLRQEVYPTQAPDGSPIGFGAKYAACIAAAARPYVLLVQEDMIPIAPTNWSWIAGKGRLLAWTQKGGLAADLDPPAFVSLFPINQSRQQWHPRSSVDHDLRTWHTFCIQPTLWRTAALLHIFQSFSSSSLLSPLQLELEVNNYTQRLARRVVVDSREWEAPQGFMAAGMHAYGYFEDLGARVFRNHGTSSTAYPCMSSAVIEGKWATTPFWPFHGQLKRLLRVHQVNVSLRGVI